MATHITFSTNTYIDRRQTFISRLSSGKYFFLGNIEVGRKYLDNTYFFSQDSTFLYYFGLDMPDLVALIDAGTGSVTLFGNEITIDSIIWTGQVPSLNQLGEQVGITDVRPLSDLSSALKGEINYLPPYRGDHKVAIHHYLGVPIDSMDQGASIPFLQAVIAQREIKSDEEIVELELAATATSIMHEEVMKRARPGMKEYELVAIASEVALSHGMQWSFNPIASINGQILHNHAYTNTLSEGKLLLFDAGCESASGYAGDMTRTYPVSQKFTKKQAEVYQVVLDALDWSIRALKPGTLYRDVHLGAAKVIFEGLKALGITKGDADEAVAKGAHTLFFPHGLGHMMGMDTHDMENFGEQYVGYTPTMIKSKEFGLKSLRLGKSLKEGFVLTVEPGIYFIPELMDVRKSEGIYDEFLNFEVLDGYRDFGGIRIEEDFVITKEGSKLLGKPLARTIDEVEALRYF